MVGDILQPTHLIFVLVVALLVLGPKKLPEVGRQLGNGLRDFRAAINGEHSEPEEVPPPYEQPVSETGLAETPSETSPEHEFAHASAESSAEDDEFAHTPSTASAVGADAAPAGQENKKPAGEHEFAYETSESAEKRTDSLS
ncbi:MAG: twin-arginine translocase TatA/TatE family subunit [Solirubrobacteraceae bacterium]|jgi:sec-independent protein translocase protein TatA